VGIKLPYYLLHGGEAGAQTSIQKMFACNWHHLWRQSSHFGGGNKGKGKDAFLLTKQLGASLQEKIILSYPNGYFR